METGTIINQYKIISAIGKGGMGEVFLAQDTKLNRQVAIKILPPEFAEDKDRMSRFVREAKSASALNHPNIITIHEIGESEGTHFIATEFIDGKTLNDYKKANPLNYKSALEIAIQVASALDDAHHAGIVHRDIKPDNVMIRSNGLVKILDFGIAKMSEPPAVGGGLSDDDATAIKQPSTMPGMIIGTPNYMSPEQARGKDVDHQTDIFSFGVVFYEILSGDSPFSGETVSDVIAAVLTKEPKRLTDIPFELEEILNKTLEKDKKNRYQTAKELLTDLREAKEELSVQSRLEKTSSPNIEEPKTQILQAQTTAEDKPKSQIQNPKSKWWLIGLLTLLLAVGGLFGSKYLSPTTKQIESIAVMPFVNESKNEDVEYLSDGMTETLISSLSNLPNLNVKPRSSVFRYKGKETNSQTIAKELNVQAILNGKVVQRGQDVSLFVELIDVALDKVVWSQQYTRKQTDLVTIQADIARDVSSKLKSKLSNADVAKVQKNSNVNPEAYQLYLKGLFQLNRRTSESLKMAEELFKQTIEKDPNYAPASAGLARTLSDSLLWSLAPAKEVYPQTKGAVNRALELDESLADAHVVLGRYLNDYEWDYPGAEKEFRRAIELEPDNPYARTAFAADFLSGQKRFDEAIAEGRRSVELDPLSKRRGLVNSLTAARRFDEAIAELKPLIPLDPNYSETYYDLGVAYYGKGLFGESVATFEKYLELDDDPVTRACFAQALAKSGNREAAVKVLDRLKLESSKRNVPGYAFALVYIALGKKNEALTWLEKNMEDRSNFATGYSTDCFLDDVRDEPRFKAMLKQMNLPE